MVIGNVIISVQFKGHMRFNCHLQWRGDMSLAGLVRSAMVNV